MSKDRPGGMDDKVPSNPGKKVADRTSMGLVKKIAGGRIETHGPKKAPSKR